MVIDLHGAGADSPSLAPSQLVDLGARSANQYLPRDKYQSLVNFLEKYLGRGAADRAGKRDFPAADPAWIAAYTASFPGVSAAQIETKPSVVLLFLSQEILVGIGKAVLLAAINGCVDRKKRLYLAESRSFIGKYLHIRS